MTVASAGADAGRDVRAFLAARRRGHRPTFFQVYATIVLGAIVVVFAHGILAALGTGSIGIRDVLTFGPLVGLVGVWSAARFGSSLGPVGFSRADVAFLLMAPIPIALLVKPKLDRLIILAIVASAIAAGCALLIVGHALTSVSIARILATVLGVVAVSASSVAVSWLVQSSRSAARCVRRIAPVVAVLVLGGGAAGWAWHSSAAVWSGPWGWAIAPLTGAPAWPIATVGALAWSFGLVWWARRRTSVVRVEQFAERARTRSMLGTSVFVLDYRGATLAYRASEPPGRISALRVPLPRAARLAVPWRDTIALLRDPARVAWAIALSAAGVIEVLTHPGRLVPSLVASAALFVAAVRVGEPLRVDVDDPDRSWSLLSRTYARVLTAHCLLPALILGVSASLTLVGAVATGLCGPWSLVAIPTLLPLLILTTVLAGALSTRRGGRIDPDLLSRLLRIDPSSPASAAMGALLLAPWLVTNVLTNTVLITVAGHAFTAGRSSIATGALVMLVAAVSSAMLLTVARRTTPPE